MDIFFNELSVAQIAHQDVSGLVYTFALVAKEALSWGVSAIRYEDGMHAIDIGYGQSLQDYCQKHKNETAVLALLSMQRIPYIPSEDDGLNKRFDKVSNFSVVVDGRKEVAFGLAGAFVSNSVGIGFNTQPWKSLHYDAEVNNGGEESVVKIMCVSSIDHFGDGELVSWAENYLPEPALEKSKNIPADKHCHLSDHHGKEILQDFANVVLRCPYVEEVVNSSDRNSDANHFIVSMHDDLVEVRLVNRGGYGIVLRTTARNKRQLKAIAEHLEKKYRDY